MGKKIEELQQIANIHIGDNIIYSSGNETILYQIRQIDEKTIIVTNSQDKTNRIKLFYPKDLLSGDWSLSK